MANACNFSNIPPEILLVIISHLPSSAALYSLSLTSRKLSSFISTHASIICNNRIQENQLYFRAALILKSSYLDGWLVPRHASIFETETQWLHEITSRSLSRATSPIGPRLGFSDCCFRTASVGSHSTVERAPRLKLRSPPRHYKSLTSETTSSHQPLLPRHPTKHHIDPSLSLTLNINSPFRLSRPGPHYLVFLERYAAEIVARWEMDIGRSTRPDTPVVIRHGNFATQLGPIVELDDEEEMERMEVQFASMLKLYCMRNWMVLCHNTFEKGVGHGVAYVEALQETKDVVSKRKVMAEDVKEKFRTAISKSKAGVKSFCRSLIPKRTPPPKRMLFGEIDTDSASSLASAGILSSGGSSPTMVEKESWVKGLLWYYGVSSQFTCGNAVDMLPEESFYEKHAMKQEEPEVSPTQKHAKLQKLRQVRVKYFSPRKLRI